MRRRGAPAGFTLVELLVAVFIFSLVMAGLSVIYSTAYRQGTRMLHEMRLKGMAIIAMRAIKTELQEATRLDKPAKGGAGMELAGFKNYSATYETTTPYRKVTEGNDVEWFYFCVSDVVPGKCEIDQQHEPRCLWMYTGKGTSLPAVTCGVDAGGSILASRMEKDAFGTDQFFSRMSAHDVDERNQVRVNWVMRIPALNVDSPMISYKVDSSFNLGFSE